MGILIKYKRVSIYRVYIPSRVKDKIIYSFHVRFNKGDLIIKLNFKVIKDEMVHY